MTIIRSTLIALIALVALGLLAPMAQGADRYEILRDCVLDGKLDGRYTAGELRDARKNLPTDSDEYSDCRDQLREAELRAASAGSGAGGSGGGAGGAGNLDGLTEAAAAVAASPASGIREQILTPGNPGETAAVQDARSGATGRKSVDVGGKPVIPGATGFSAGAGARDLPPSLLAVLILLGAGSLALAVPAVRKHARIPVFRRR